MTSNGPDRRREPRVAIAARILCGPADGEGSIVRHVRDISRAGVFVLSDVTWSPGTELSFEILADDEKPIAKGLGRVVWVHPSSGMGLEFIEVDLGNDLLDLLESTRQDIDRPQAARVETQKVKVEPAAGITIGVDLGTSNTCASAVLSGRPQVIPTRYGTNTIPSVVTLDSSGGLLVGHAAARRMVLEPHRTVYGSKRLLGRTFLPEVAKEYQPHFAYPVVEAEGQRFGAGLEGRVLSMEEVATQILAEVKKVAEAHLRTSVQRAVISVPAYFSEVQRDAVREAARAAGLDVRRIISEPTAAAVAYGFERGERARLAVYDFGGGTFDFSVLEVQGNRFRVLATGGDNFLGGVDVDDLLASHLLEEFQRQHHVELSPDQQQVARLRVAAEEAKRILSVQRRFAVHLPQFAMVGGRLRDLGMSLDRSTLEALASDLVAATFEIASTVMELGEIPVSSIEDVILVGGMTRMPLVQARIEAHFGRRPNRRINPDEAVALGAALVASTVESEASVSLVDVLPLSIGVVGGGRRFVPLIRRNTAVPATYALPLRVSREGQTDYEFPLFQGERDDAAANEYLGTAAVRGLPAAPAGTEVGQLTLTFDEQCMLTLRARETRSGAEVEVELDRGRPAADVIRRLGPYRGDRPAEKPKKTQSAIGHFFSRVGRLFKK